MFSSMSYDMHGKVDQDIRINKAVFRQSPSSVFPLVFLIGNAQYTTTTTD